MATSRRCSSARREIKQEKRRLSLIEHADNARLSKKLVTLDDHVKLDVPIGDLAVHEPDHKRLVAFLKAMEFNSLMRRVSEFASIDPGHIEAEARFAGHHPGADIFPAPPAQEGGAPPVAPQQRRRGGPEEEFKGQALLPLTRPADLGRQGGAETPANFSATPQALAAARMEAARAEKFDRTKYETVRSLPRLNAWIERARDLGFVAIDIMTASLDPMQAELCGFALAVGPNEACYVPLGHRQGGEGGAGGLFRGDAAPDQIAERAALDALKPLLTDRGVLKIGHDLKFDWQVFARRGIEIESYADTMLMSYALDAGRANHGLESLADHTFNHAAVDINGLIKEGKTKITFDAVGIDRASEYAAEKADIAFRLWQVLKARLPGRARAHGVRDAGAAAPRGIGADGTARHLDRPKRAVTAVR